ncbi:hypothetical protein LOTGIDRAFT_121599, partial [Lottia gigantea]
EVVTVSPSVGLICKNSDQKDKRCEDYKVRFCCPKADKWTQWFDRDNPSGTGDWEHLASLLDAYPGRVCKHPTAVDAQLTSGAPYTDGGDTLTLSPSQGLICQNNLQADKSCNDYKVRFCCPQGKKWKMEEMSYTFSFFLC